MRYFFFLVVYLSTATCFKCPSGFTGRKDGTCFSRIYERSSRIAAYDKCGGYQAYQYQILNKYQNDAVKEMASVQGVNGYIWLGLTCTSNLLTSCKWDNGTYLTKTSFQRFSDRSPFSYLGQCVVMRASTGLWYSANCNDEAYFGCTYKPRTVPKIPLSCSFVMDWSHLGGITTRNVTARYDKQQKYVNNVASILYANPTLFFQGNFGFFGHSDQCSITSFNYFSSYNQFSTFLATHNPSNNCQISLCESFKTINGYQTPIGTENACLVFFSGESPSSFLSCPTSLNQNKFQHIFGVSLNGATGVMKISNTTVSISNGFDTNDAFKLANVILNTVKIRDSIK